MCACRTRGSIYGAKRSSRLNNQSNPRSPIAGKSDSNDTVNNTVGTSSSAIRLPVNKGINDLDWMENVIPIHMAILVSLQGQSRVYGLRTTIPNGINDKRRK